MKRIWQVSQKSRKNRTFYKNTKYDRKSKEVNRFIKVCSKIIKTFVTLKTACGAISTCMCKINANICTKYSVFQITFQLGKKIEDQEKEINSLRHTFDKQSAEIENLRLEVKGL